MEMYPDVEYIYEQEQFDGSTPMESAANSAKFILG